jgi:prepilin-type N-terminal cleavage/methylation domain-containing protein
MAGCVRLAAGGTRLPVARGGYTLVEILVALIIGSIISTAVLAIVSQQATMTRLQNAREEVQQNGRGAVELLASEIRSAPREGLQHAAADRMILRVPVAAGTLCTTPVPASGTIHVLVSARNWTRTAPDTLALAARITLSPAPSESEPFPGPATEAAVPAAAEYATMSRFSVVLLSSVGAPCTALGAVSGARMLALTPMAPTTSYTTAMREVAHRAELYLFDEVEYSVGASTVPGQWILRTARGSARTLAGPLPETGTTGLRFRYFVNETELTALPITDRTVLGTITRVRIEVTTVSRWRGGGAADSAPESRTLSTDVYLRNFRGA